MRDPERIDRILGGIAEAWKRPSHRDMRFGQLLINMGLVPDGDIWHVEDDKYEAHIQRYLGQGPAVGREPIA